MTDFSKEYLAGFFDADGWVSGRYYPGKDDYIQVSMQIGLANTNKKIVKIFYQLFGGTYYEKQENKKHKKVYRWCIGSRKGIEKFIYELGNWIFVKRPQLSIIAFYFKNKTSNSGRNRTEEEMELLRWSCEQLRNLNVKGVNKYIKIKNGDVK